MPVRFAFPPPGYAGNFLARLARDSGGNTLALIAASIAPIMAMVGGGVDMGRSYLAQARLQQACDAGVLAARKRLGSEAAVSGAIPPDAGMIGQRFFNINFRSGAYGSTDRSFVMTLESDFAVSGVATVTVPTTIMRIFGFQQVPLKVECEAQINFSNTDVMMVLDVTGSMAQTNPGDSASRIDVLKSTVVTFQRQLAASAQAGARIRYGFVPYSTNVNVGALLEDDWVVDDWRYQSRKLWLRNGDDDNSGPGGGGDEEEDELPSGLAPIIDPSVVGTYSYTTSSQYVSGQTTTSQHSTYAATLSASGYSCPTRPANTATATTTSSTSSVAVTGPPAGVRVTTTYVRTRNGSVYQVQLQDRNCVVTQTAYTNYVDTYRRVTEPSLSATSFWLYNRLPYDVSNWRTAGNGCIEERSTYVINDYDNVDLARALDLDIDRVPSRDNPATQWRPMYPSLIYARALKWNGTGSFSTAPIITNAEYVAPGELGTAACPAPAKKLASLDETELQAYLDTLKPVGSTYHDIGMIWGGRLLSPTGLFAAENSDSGGSPSNRNLIFLTDGETAPSDLSYSSYGLEPLDQRRWAPGSPLSLTRTVEERFAFACREIRKKNISIWVVAFGVDLNPVLKECAGEGHYFAAEDAVELNASFATIAKKMSNLRIER